MLPLLPIIASGLATAFAVVLKHPIVTKMLIFAFFLGIISYSIGYIKGLVAPYIVDNPLLASASYFGLLDGLSLYLSILISGFAVKQIMAFIRT